MVNVTCDNKINNRKCRSKQSIPDANIIPDNWVQIKILIVSGEQVAKFFCPKCVVKLIGEKVQDSEDSSEATLELHSLEVR